MLDEAHGKLLPGILGNGGNRDVQINIQYERLLKLLSGVFQSREASFILGQIN